MKFKWIILCCVAAFFSGCDQQNKQENKVHIYGTIEEQTGKVVEMSFNGAASDFGTSRNMMLQVDATGHFDTTFYLDKPEYFNIERNTIYLTPGDELECKICSSNSSESVFSGKGYEANMYMRHRLFPKGGSFLEGGRNIFADFSKMKDYILTQAAQRKKELESLVNVSSDFKKLEFGRITADIINSFDFYPSYAPLRWKEKREKCVARVDSIRYFLDSLALTLNEEYLLDVAVVRQLVKKHKGLNWCPAIQEWLHIGNLSRKIGNNMHVDTLERVTKEISLITREDYRDELYFAINQVKGMLPGSPVVDVALKTTDGKEIKLSDLKGKILYLDFWATWCGPCCYEAPFFEQLAEKFVGEDIEFISISIDEDMEKWLAYLQKDEKKTMQYNSLDPVLKEKWNIRGIPRFVLIDSDFKILNPDAPRPSDKGTEQYLRELIQK